MKLLEKRSIVFVLLMVFGLVHLAVAQKPTRIKDIIDERYDYRQNTVIVQGVVVQYEDNKEKHSKCYSLKGDWGGIIKVIANVDWPNVNVRYEVKGIVVIDDKDEVSIIEQWRREQLVVKTSLGDEPIPPPEDGEVVYYLIGAAALLLIVIITLAVVMISGNRKVPYITTPISGPGGMSSNVFTPPEPKILETPTIKIAAPPPGTLKLLPGHLEVVGGDDTLKEIRFYKLKNQEEPEITFGRGSGPLYTHVQLKPITVSSKQAKLIYTNKKYVLINYATVNPTSVNGAPLSKDDSVTLEEGSKIEMGELQFIFHEK